MCVCRPASGLGGADPGYRSNYQDYRDLARDPGTLDPPPPHARHVSDSNMNRYGSNFQRPTPRGTSTSSMDPNLYHGPTKNTNNQFYGNNYSSGRGPTPTYDNRPPSAQAGFVGRGPTPVQYQDQEGRSTNFHSNHGNYQVIHRDSPININSGENTRWNNTDKTDIQRGNGHVTHSNNYAHMSELQPLGPGNYGNAGLAYREPVFTSIAGKRPVKSMTQQPNSAKV